MADAEKLDLIETHVRNIMHHFNVDMSEEGLKDTPKRVAKFLMEFNQGFAPAELFKAKFPTTSQGMVVQTGIPFRALCEHHLLPFFGQAAIGYVPNKYVLGLSKMTRLVQALGVNRPTIQESITQQVADLMTQHLEPKGVIVVVEAEHTCSSVRGANAPGVVTKTSAVKGVFRDVPACRQEFFALIK